MTVERGALLKLAHEVSDLAGGNGDIVDLEHDPATCEVCNQVAEIIAAFIAATAPDPVRGTPQHERYSRSMKENTDARSEVHAATGTAASGFSPQEAPRRMSADDMAELNRQISEYKARCDRGETVSGSDARWLLNELIYAYDHSVGTPPSADDQTVSSPPKGAS